MQDFTGVPAIVDLAAMRDAFAALGGDPKVINPLQPAELVIDHSVQVDYFASAEALKRNTAIEFKRNQERYAFLRWGQRAFKNFKVVPPNTGIVHQVNIECLARVVFADTLNGQAQAYFDTLVGTDSHTTMVNGLGVLGWGVGGIEAEAAMLGQPVTMLIPHVVGLRLVGRLGEGVTATDLVLTVTERLRQHGVVGKLVECFGPGLAYLPLADRATISNMSPEFGSTCALFPIDAETLRYLRDSGRTPEQVALVEAYAKAQGAFYDARQPEAQYSAVVELNLSRVEPSIAGPKRPQDRVSLAQSGESFRRLLEEALRTENASPAQQPASSNGEHLGHGSVVIAAITSCTNTSNPSVMLGAGLLAQKAVAKGLQRKPWVKTSLAPGSKVVTAYLEAAGVLPALEQLGFHLVGYGCTTCIGNSGPLPEAISAEIQERELLVCAVLSGNRNFEGRVHPEVKANYLMSPPLVVAYALAGRADIDLTREPLGHTPAGQPVYLKDIWPSEQEIQVAIERSLKADLFVSNYADVFQGGEEWNALSVPQGDRYVWDPTSTYVKHPPYFEGLSPQAPREVRDLEGARVLAVLGDSVTTDHISPAGSIKASSPAGQYLLSLGVGKEDFNSYGARRGNHEVMVRGTFANIRLRNQLAPGTEGGWTTHLPTGEVVSIYEAAMRYKEQGIPLIILAGKEYGSGSSRDWAAKGPALLGVSAVIAQSFERIHRSNLIGMGILPLEFLPGQSAQTQGLTGREVFSITGLQAGAAQQFAQGRTIIVHVHGETGRRSFPVQVRIDTPQELEYYRNGGILPYVLRQLYAKYTRGSHV
jgi:aconitate hydratase